MHHSRSIDRHIGRPNMSKVQVAALKTIEDNGHCVTPTDKTNRMTVFDKTFLAKKLDESVLNRNLFEPLSGDQSHKIEADANLIWSEIVCSRPSITDKQHDDFVKRHSRAPALKILLKDHKAGFPDCKVRTIQPVRGSAVENFDTLLGLIFGQCRRFHRYTVCNSVQFLERIKGLTVHTESIQFSMDIESMFPSLPTCERAVGVVEKHLNRHREHLNLFGLEVCDVISILRFVLRNIILESNGSAYRQLSGVGTGYHSSVGYAGIIVDEMVVEILQDFTRIEGFSVYVDDSWGIFNGPLEDLKVLQAQFNSYWEGLNFTMEVEDSSNSIVFLDLRIVRREDSLVTYFYRKDTHSGSYLHFSSHCPMVQKINIVRNEVRRIVGNCTHREDAEPHIKILRDNLLRSGYPDHFITKYIEEGLRGRAPAPLKQVEEDENLTVLAIPYISEAYTRVVKKEAERSGLKVRVLVKGHPTLKRRYHKPIKPQCVCEICQAGVPCDMRHVVYEAKCESCTESYIGVTTRPFKARWNEHERSIRLGNSTSALSDHLKVCDNKNKTICGFKWSVRDTARNYKDSFIREGVAIRLDQPKINRNTPAWVQYAMF